jgi:hypothetical protein
MVAEVVHGAPCRFSDPARFSLAHGGKDRHPFPVPTRVYDRTIEVMKSAVLKAKLGQQESSRRSVGWTSRPVIWRREQRVHRSRNTSPTKSPVRTTMAVVVFLAGSLRLRRTERRAPGERRFGSGRQPPNPARRIPARNDGARLATVTAQARWRGMAVISELVSRTIWSIAPCRSALPLLRIASI